MRKNELKIFSGIIFVMSIVVSIGVYRYISSQSIQNLANNMVEECHKKNDGLICYSESLVSVNQKTSFGKTLEVLTQVQKLDPKTKYCHIIAHYIASNEYQKDPSTWQTKFKFLKDPYSCNTGFIHGMVEAVKKNDPQISFNENVIQQICTEIYRNTSPSFYFPCAHASGHVVIVETQGKPYPATQICLKLPGHMQPPCLEGIFMEYVNRPNLTFHGFATGKLKFDDTVVQGLQTACNQYTGQGAIGCWKALSQVFQTAYGSDMAVLKSHCNKSNSLDAARECYFRSFDYALNDSAFNPQQLPTICQDFLTDKSQLFRCYDNAIIGLLYKKEENKPLVEKLCATSPDFFKEQCRNIINKYYKSSTNQLVKLSHLVE